MRKLVSALFVVMLLAACQSDPTPVPDQDVQPATQATGETAQPPTPLPAPTVTPEVLPNPDDPLTIVLGGDFDNGGYWTWDDISNLLGVYAQYDEYTSVTLGEQAYTGVPLSYLLDYARPDPNVVSVIVFDQEGTMTDIPMEDVTNCPTCLAVRADDASITLVFPLAEPVVVEQAMRIDVR